VQSFQQQVSQQLQSSLAQSNEAQEGRLRNFEQQQREMDNHIQALEQSLAQVHTPVGRPAQSATDPFGTYAQELDVEPPRVNVRKATSAEYAGGGGALASGLLPTLLGGSGGETPPAGLRSLNSPLGQPASAIDERPYSNSEIPAGRRRVNDSNIAPHGFVDGRLLNGVVTQQGGPERESIVALSGDYQSANGFTVDLNGCFALVQGRPEIATGRIDFKLSRLTCNFRDGASRTWDASGWLVDADGIRGVRAVIVDNTGRKAAVAAGGGAIGGIGQRLSQQQYDINSGPAGFGSSSSFAGNVGRDALGGAASGGANALGQAISDYYNLYGPSLQVGGGTRVTVVLANDLRLPYSGRDISQTHTANP
jgi:conjugal transfer pilus assembly protein TraB